MVEKVLQLNRERIIFWTLSTILLFSLGFYMYFIQTTIHNVVIRQNSESEISKMTLSLGTKEFEYISKSNAITLQLAYSFGFKEAQVKNYISQIPETKVAFLSH